MCAGSADALFVPMRMHAHAPIPLATPPRPPPRPPFPRRPRRHVGAHHPPRPREAAQCLPVHRPLEEQANGAGAGAHLPGSRARAAWSVGKARLGALPGGRHRAWEPARDRLPFLLERHGRAVAHPLDPNSGRPVRATSVCEFGEHRRRLIGRFARAARENEVDRKVVRERRKAGSGCRPNFRFEMGLRGSFVCASWNCTGFVRVLRWCDTCLLLTLPMV